MTRRTPVQKALEAYSDVALEMALQQLQRAGEWWERQQAIKAEIARRNRNRRGKEVAR